MYDAINSPLKSPSAHSDLPTTPIGRQQIVDIKAGAILRHNRKNRRLFGCPLTPLLAGIVFIKALLFTIWLYREFNTFDFHCAIVSPIIEDTENVLIRKKRFSVDFDNFEPLPPRVMTLEDQDESDDTELIEQREKAKKKRPMFGGGLKKQSNEESEEEEERRYTPATTIVTLTNTQIVPIADGKQGTIRMKTIRNRIESVGGEDEEFVEIDIGTAPRIYVSKIRSRHDEIPLLTTREAPDVSETETAKKRKGLGRKKDKKRKGLGRKKNKEILNNYVEGIEPTTISPTQSTKGPRHLFSPPQTITEGATTTPHPHQSHFLSGAVDPLDPNFSNKGEIRGYPMQKAEKKPKGGRKKDRKKTTSSIRLSEETRRMWEMDEMNFTTLIMPKTTQMTGAEVKSEEIDKSIEQSHPKSTSGDKFENQNANSYDLSKIDEDPQEDDDNIWKDSAETDDADSSVEIEGTNKNAKSEEEGIEYGHPYRPEVSIVEGQSNDKNRYDIAKSSTERMIEDEDYDRRHPTPSGRYNNKPNDFFTRSPPHSSPRDSLTETAWTTIPTVESMRGREEQQDQQATTPIIFDDLDSHINFKAQLDSFASSAACILRTLFDIWCCFQLLCLIPFTFGFCSPRWCLFICHVVMDFVCLVIGFLISITMAVLSLVLYCMVDQMESTVLVHSLLIAFAIDILLLFYSILVVTTFRVCDRLVSKYTEEGEFDSNGIAL